MLHELKIKWLRHRANVLTNRYEDADHYYDTWGDHFGIPPSRKKAMRKRVDKAEARMERAKTRLHEALNG